MKENRLKILNYSLKSLWLLIFPIGKAIMNRNADVNFFKSWLSGAYLDFFILLLVISIGYVKWSLAKFEYDENKIQFNDFLIFQKQKTFQYKNISSISAKQTIFLKFFKAIRVSIDTSGGEVTKSDLDLLMNVEDWENFKKKFPFKEQLNKFKFEYKAGWGIMVIFSLIFSSSISGAVYIATLLSQLGKTAGDLLMSQRNTFENISEQMAENIALKIPPIGIALALLIILTKLLSFVLNLFRYANFTIENNKKTLKINSGMFGKREFYLLPDKINYTDLGQNLLMKIFRVTSIHVNCAGYGNNRNEIPVFLPIMSTKQAENVLNRLYIYGRLINPQFRPKKTSFFRFIYLPLLIIFILFSAAYIFAVIFPYYKDLTKFFLIILMIPATWLLLVKFISVFNTGYSIENGIYNINICKGLQFHNIAVQEQNIVKTVITQNFFQKYSKKCDVIFYLRSEKEKKYTVKSLLLSNALNSESQ
jgi:putative membrane protein